MKTNLFRDLDRPGWHSSIMTTYSVDPAFYDASIEYRLRTNGCVNNILMADTVMLKRALGATPEAFRSAGRHYVMAPVQVKGCFHPKVHLRLGVDKSRLIIGSANATAAGWGRNQEIVTAIDWSRRGDDPNLKVTAPLIKKAYDYLCSWLTEVPGDTLDFKLRLHRRYSSWLNDFQVNDEPIILSDGSAIDILCERGDGKPGMFERLLSLTEGETIRRLVIVSPYWDSDLAALRDLRKSLNLCPTVIALNPNTNEFPMDALDADDPTVFAAIHDDKDARRFLHAKVFLIETDAADHLLFGSANCSDDALGRIGNTANNAEVSVYRRFQRGHGLEVLELDLGKSVERDDIRRTVPDTQIFKPGSSAKPAGMIEIVERSLTWFPADSADPNGASILVGGDTHALDPVGNGQFQAHLQSKPDFPLIVRVQFRDGTRSDPVIVNDEVLLKQASPGVTDKRLQSAFNRVLAGEEDIIDLAREAHRLFTPEDGGTDKDRWTIGPRPGASDESGPEESAPTDSNYQECETAEDFRRAVARKPGTGKSGRFGLEDPGLLGLLSIILRGIVDVGGKEARKRLDEEEERDLEAGDTEDGDENDERSNKQVKVNPSTYDSNPEERIFTPAEIKKRRRQLFKALKAFESMLDQLAQNPKLISNRLTAQTAFVFNLMLFACTRDYRTSDGTSVKLMHFVREVMADDVTFDDKAMRLLKKIWIGGDNDAARLVNHLPAGPRDEPMLDDIFVLIAMSRWAIVRVFLAVSATRAGSRRAAFVEKLAVKIYRSSFRYGPVHTESEREIIGKLDASLGYEMNKTKNLIEQCRKFAAEAEGQVNAEISQAGGNATKSSLRFFV